MKAALRAFIRQRVGGRCEYCRFRQWSVPRRVSDAVMVAGPFKARRLVATELSRRFSDAEIR